MQPCVGVGVSPCWLASSVSWRKMVAYAPFSRAPTTCDEGHGTDRRPVCSLGALGGVLGWPSVGQSVSLLSLSHQKKKTWRGGRYGDDARACLSLGFWSLAPLSHNSRQGMHLQAPRCRLQCMRVHSRTLHTLLPSLLHPPTRTLSTSSPRPQDLKGVEWQRVD